MVFVSNPLFRGEIVPDPFHLLQRLSNLESSLHIIQSKVLELDQESQAISTQVVEALLNNSLALDKVDFYLKLKNET